MQIVDDVLFFKTGEFMNKITSCNIGSSKLLLLKDELPTLSGKLRYLFGKPHSEEEKLGLNGSFVYSMGAIFKGDLLYFYLLDSAQHKKLLLASEVNSVNHHRDSRLVNSMNYYAYHIFKPFAKLLNSCEKTADCEYQYVSKISSKFGVKKGKPFSDIDLSVYGNLPATTSVLNYSEEVITETQI
jgi:hypothetical protein